MSLLQIGVRTWGYATRPYQYNKNQKHLLSTKHDSETFAYRNLNPQNTWDISLQSIFTD